MTPRTPKKVDVSEHNTAPGTVDNMNAQGAAEVLVGDIADLEAAEGSQGKPADYPSGVFLLLGNKEQRVPRGSIIVVCRKDGFRRAGVEHPPVAIYPVDHFSAEQLSQLRAEPVLELIGVAE
ncbi:HI1506-related protein [Acetobacter fabarum]|uniref:HI1506-related protein n=1 Tax=Acetobacter fabarum TaxID=483199 RepID=UPI00312B6464